MPARNTILHLRLDDQDSTIRPSDAKGNLADMVPISGGAMPVVVDGFSGYARSFLGDNSLTASDVVAGSTLATRDVTVQALVRWDFDEANDIGFPVGTIYQRGTGGSTVQAISVSAQLRIVNFTQRIAEIRFVWQSIDGLTDYIQPGGHFVVPAVGSTSWLMITATRHWISANEVEIQYYVGSQLVGEHFSTDGSIGGGTTGVTYVGGTETGEEAPFIGEIDELRVLDYHVTQEEVEATWLRLSKWQPSGYTTVKQLMPPGAPISSSPTSRIQRLLKGIGHALGYSNAQADNARRNMMPDRAYGDVLERWEKITGEAPRALDTTKQRRTRVVSHFQQRQGVSPPGVRAAIKDQVQLLPEQIPLYAFQNDVLEDFASGLSDQRKWWFGVNSGGWSVTGGQLRYNQGAGIDHRFLDPIPGFPWKCNLLPVGGNARDAHMLLKLIPTTLPSGMEAGICFFNWIRGEALFFGLRNDAADGVIKFVRQEYKLTETEFMAAVTLAAPVVQQDYYLHLFQQHSDDPLGLGTDPRIHLNEWTHPTIGAGSNDICDAKWTFQWATTLAGLAGSQVTDVFARARYQWAGPYVRSTNAAPGAVDIKFDEITLRSRYGDRPFRWYAYRDPTLPGTPDIVAANGTAGRLAHAHTFGRVVNNLSAKCDDASSICDQTPIGGF